MGLNSHIVNLSQVYSLDEDLVGKRAHELGILYKLGIPLPKGFVITTDFFKEFLRLTGIDKEIKEIQALNHPAISDSLPKLFYPIRRQIMRRHIPQNLAVLLHQFYRKLAGVFRERSLHVSSSSRNHRSIVFPSVSGDANLVLKIKEIFSLFLEESVAVIVQENVITGAKRKVFTDNPMIDENLTEIQKSKLINYCRIIQKYFYFPKEVEYVVQNDKIFLTGINPFTGIADKFKNQMVQNKQARKVMIKGIPINPGIVTGIIKVLHDKHSAVSAKRGEIMVLSNLDSFLFKKIKNAKGVIADSVIQNSLDKTLYRKDFQIPTIVGAKDATKIFKNGNVVTVNGVNGEIYSGGLIY